jgi:hypothetical protein
MNELKAFPPELAFLSAYVDSDAPRYRSASWLHCDFFSLKWKVYALKPFELDWQVRLGRSGHLLTAPKHAGLLEAFRSWLIVQTHVDWTGKLLSAPRTEYRALRCVVHCIDYFLLRADELGLPEHGLRAVTANDIRAMIASIGSNRTIAQGVYEWPRRLSALLREMTAKLPATDFAFLLKTVPFIAEDIPDPEDCVTDLSTEEIIRARAWLWKRNGYAMDTNAYGFRFRPNSSLLAKMLYGGTLGGEQIYHGLPPELGLVPGHRFFTEYSRARITSERDERMSTRSFRSYCGSVASLELLHQAGLAVPLWRGALEQTDVDLKPVGRYRTLPQSVVFPTLRAAIEFALTNGRALVDSYLNVARVARDASQPIGVYAFDNDIQHLLHPDCRALGVERWSIEWNSMPGGHAAPHWLDRPTFYKKLRENVGLWECLRVLYGAIQIVVGTLMARRSGALIDLVAGGCLDTNRTHLIFANRKSGIGEFLETLARPIPPVAVELIDMLERLQAGLIDLGLLPGFSKLFAFPANRGLDALCSVYSHSFNESFNYFCDWAQTPLDSEGKRYYVRQHQLRRFFCMLFFWGGSFGGLETLRWFLGHADPAHLWHYITESTPGIVVRSVAAQWATYGIQHGAPETETLGSILREHFGTSNFEVLEAEVLERYLEDLIEEGRLTIEPQFLDGGRQYRIAVILRSAMGLTT